MFKNCAVSSLGNREVSTIEGALIHTDIGVAFGALIDVHYKVGLAMKSQSS